ncbi:MAG: hypothetical protein EXR72_10260 [Myxococcales bacterium]|nr:hypothetical protein [Myxococcales bacterium]
MLLRCSMMALLALAACKGAPVPADKSAYVGNWKGVGIDLTVTADGGLSYKKVSGGGTKSLNAPIKEWTGNDFSAGFGPLTTTFKVDKVPWQEGGQWKMVVDGNELVKLPGVPAEGRGGSR